MFDYYNFPKAAARPKAKAGKARKKFGTTWWGKKWVEILSDYETDQRMSRGRAYARADKVNNFKIHNGRISASVEGSLGNYSVNIKFKAHSKGEWKKISKKLSEIPIILSKLLNNEMPENITEITGFDFVPNSFDSECSCPDYSNPCKHIAAVFYVIADEIDYDPMILFKLKGMSKKELFKSLEIMDSEEIKEESKPKIIEKSAKKKIKRKAKPLKKKKGKSLKKKRGKTKLKINRKIKQKVIKKTGSFLSRSKLKKRILKIKKSKLKIIKKSVKKAKPVKKNTKTKHRSVYSKLRSSGAKKAKPSKKK